jgi:menaquinone-dependent protoporphyrinogen IX oxidase
MMGQIIEKGEFVMKHGLIAYASHSGSTKEVAQFMGDELKKSGFAIDVIPINDVSDLSQYDFIVAGGLIYRFSWHFDIIGFLKKNLQELEKRPVYFFVTGLGLVKTPQCDQMPYPVFIDPSIMKIVDEKNKPGLFDNLATLDHYLVQALPLFEKVKPAKLGFFAGKLDLSVLNFPEKAVMWLLMRLTDLESGDRRNWNAIRMWVREIATSEKE